MLKLDKLEKFEIDLITLYWRSQVISITKVF